VFAAIFEVQPRQGRFDEYLSLAKYLRPKLEAIDGFIEIDRFVNARTQGRVLSLSTWRDEKAVVRWRTQKDHQAIQQRGRFEVFQDYHLRVGEVIADTAPPAGLAVVEQRFDATEAGRSKFVTLTELMMQEPAADADLLGVRLRLSAEMDGLIEQGAFESIYHPGRLLLVAAWRDVDRARSWSPTAPLGATPMRHRCVRVIRDYGMFDRREAPQFYPVVNRGAA
jgi:heme-degrading monooxygenase HmoA